MLEGTEDVLTVEKSNLSAAKSMIFYSRKQKIWASDHTRARPAAGQRRAADPFLVGRSSVTDHSLVMTSERRLHTGASLSTPFKASPT